MATWSFYLPVKAALKEEGSPWKNGEAPEFCRLHHRTLHAFFPCWEGPPSSPVLAATWAEGFWTLDRDREFSEMDVGLQREAELQEARWRVYVVWELIVSLLTAFCWVVPPPEDGAVRSLPGAKFCVLLVLPSVRPAGKAEPWEPITLAPSLSSKRSVPSGDVFLNRSQSPGNLSPLFSECPLYSWGASRLQR